jgi:hypothetical protein
MSDAWRGGVHDNALLKISPKHVLLEIEKARSQPQVPRHAPIGVQQIVSIV